MISLRHYKEHYDIIGIHFGIVMTVIITGIIMTITNKCFFVCLSFIFFFKVHIKDLQRPRTNNSRYMDKFNKLNVTGLFENSFIYEKCHMMC